MSLIIDSFAGAGGASLGILQATGRHPDIAINHDESALDMHAENHPETAHIPEDIWNVVPSDLVQGRSVDLAWFSPDCRHFSRAKGSKPVSKKVRGLAWVVVKWAKQVRPTVICLENVPEFQDWGPTRNDKPVKARKGETFARWTQQLRDLGYVVEWREMNAADFGAATHRRRLFLVARCDGEPITWPEPTHGPGLEDYVPASSIIDWTLPGRSIFGRKRPLAEKTMARIAKGLRRYVIDSAESAYTVKFYGTAVGSRLSDPLGTITSQGNKYALIVPWIMQYYGGMVGKPVSVPLPTVTARDHNALVSAQVSERVDPDRVDEVRSFLTKYYGTAVGQTLNEPAHTITTKARLGLVEIHGKDYQIVDITLRMLEPHELAAAQGFPSSYIFRGTKAQKIAKIGNSVVPLMAERIVAANWTGAASREEAVA